jgi:hypothetical protein
MYEHPHNAAVAIDPTHELIEELRALRAESRDPRVRAAVDESLAFLESGAVVSPDLFKRMTDAARALLPAAHERHSPLPPRPPANRHERRARAALARKKGN